MAIIVNILQAIIILTTLFLATVYSLSMLFIHQIRHRNNILTVNVCLATISCCLFWIFYSFKFNYDYEDSSHTTRCSILDYFQTMCTLQVPLAVIVVSIHRFCCIIYHGNIFFKTIRWTLICIIIQWIIAIIFPLPVVIFHSPSCEQDLWMRIYIFIIIVLIPSVVCLIINLHIFRYVRLSSKRVQPTLVIGRTNSDNNQMRGITRRDLHLLRHIIVMFCIFTGGWSPIFIFRIVQPNISLQSVFLSILIILSELTLLINILNLFLYNHQLRQCLKDIFFKFK